MLLLLDTIDPTSPVVEVTFLCMHGSTLYACYYPIMPPPNVASYLIVQPQLYDSAKQLAISRALYIAIMFKKTASSRCCNWDKVIAIH